MFPDSSASLLISMSKFLHLAMLSVILFSVFTSFLFRQSTHAHPSQYLPNALQSQYNLMHLVFGHVQHLLGFFTDVAALAFLFPKLGCGTERGRDAAAVSSALLGLGISRPNKSKSLDVGVWYKNFFLRYICTCYRAQ